MGKCWAIAKSTNEHCSKKALPGSKFCWHHYPKGTPLLFVIIGSLLGFGIQWAFDTVTESDEERLITNLTSQLEPFVQLADSSFPGMESEEALNTLRSEYIEFRDRVIEEESTLREMGVNLKVYFSGKWKSSPSSIIPISLGKTFPCYLRLVDRSEVNRPVEYLAYNKYERTMIDSTHLLFETTLSVPMGEYPLGQSDSSLVDFNVIWVRMPLSKSEKNFVDGSIYIDSCKVGIHNNRKLVCQFMPKVTRPFEVPVIDRHATFQFGLTPNLYAAIVASNQSGTTW